MKYGKIHCEYVIASYMGPRARGGQQYDNDRAYFLRQHLRVLEELPHPYIDGITIVNNDVGEPAEAFLEEIPSHVGGAPVSIFRRPNEGMSYEAFAHAVKMLPNASHFILSEDDYVFTQPNFDEWMLDRMPHGFLCAGAWDWRWHPHEPPRKHAAIFGGIVHGVTLRKAFANGWHGKPVLLSADQVGTGTRYQYGYHAQVTLSWAMISNGFQIVDWLDDFASIYWTGHSIDWYAQGHGAAAFMIPIQAVGLPTTLHRHSQRPKASGAGMPPMAPYSTELATLQWDGTTT